MNFTFLDEWAPDQNGHAASAGQAGQPGQASAGEAATGNAVPGQHGGALPQGMAGISAGVSGNPPQDAPGLAAMGLVENAREAPEDMASLAGLARLLDVPQAMLARHPEHVRKRLLARALARNPGLLSYARENPVNASIAVKYASEGHGVRQAFVPLPMPEGIKAAKGAPDQESGRHARRVRPVPEKPEAGSQPMDLTTGLARLQDAGAEMPDPERGADLDAFPPGQNAEADQSAASEMPAWDTRRADPEMPDAGQDDDPHMPDADQDDAILADLALDLRGASLFGSGGDLLLRAAALRSGQTERATGDGNSFLAQLADPFKNFANGWLDMGKAVMGMGQSLSDLSLGRESGVSKWFQNWIRDLSAMQFETARPESFAGRLAQDVVRSVPQQIAQIGLWLASGPLLSTGYMFGQIYGSDYLRHAESGVNPENAAFAGLVDAALQSGMERMGLHAILATPGIGQFARKLGGMGILQLGRAAGKAAAVEGATEAMQQIPQYLTDWWARSSLQNRTIGDRVRWTYAMATDARNLLEGTKEALYEGLVGGVLGGGIGGIQHVVARRRLDPEIRTLLESERDRAQAVMRRLGLNQAIETARERISGIRDPEQALAITRNSLPGDMRSALIDPVDLSSLLARNPNGAARVLEATGSDVETVNRAIAQGMDLEVDLASAIVANSGEGAQVREILRLSSAGPTLAQATSWNPQERMGQVLRVLNQEDDLEDFGFEGPERQYARDASELTQMSARVNRQMTRLTRELKKAGLTDLEAETNAALIRAHAMTWWKRYGVDAEALLAQWRIERGESPLESGLQSAPMPEPAGAGVQDAAPGAGRYSGSYMAENGAEAQAAQAARAADRAGNGAILNNLENAGESAADAERPGNAKAGEPGASRDNGASGEANGQGAAADGTAGRSIVHEELEPEEINEKEDWPEWLVGEKKKFVPRRLIRGQALIGRGQRVIRLFSQRDISTFAHEASHIFLDDLLLMARADASASLARFEEELAKQTGQDMDFAQEMTEVWQKSMELYADRPARALARTAREYGRMATLERKGAEEAATRLQAPERPLEQEEENGLANARHLHEIRALTARALARAASASASHIEALAQAREDAAIFARDAGVSEKALQKLVLMAGGEATQGARAERNWVKLQEAGASALVRYLAHGEAPSARLAPVLGRFASWLGNLWKRYKNIDAKRPDPELSAAIDRLLATDYEIAAQEGLAALKRGERALIQDRRLAPGDSADLEEMLRRVQLEGLKKVRSLRQKREETAKRARVREVMASLREEPFWQLAENPATRFLRPAVEDYLGRERTSRLFEAWPRLMGKRKGLNPADVAIEAGYDSPEAMFSELYERLVTRRETRRLVAEKMVNEEFSARALEAGQFELDSPEQFGQYLEKADLAVAKIVASVRLKSNEEIARWVDHSHVPMVMVESMAQERVQNTPLSLLTEAALQKMLDRALRRRNVLLKSDQGGDLMEAMNQSTEARVINEMIKLARMEHQKAADLRRWCRDVSSAKPGTFSSLQTEALRMLLEGYGLGHMRGPADRSYGRALPDMIAQIVREEDMGGSLPAFPRWLQTRSHPDGWWVRTDQHIDIRKLTPAQIRELENLLRFIVHSGRDSRDREIRKERKYIEDTVRSCVDKMGALPDKSAFSGNRIRDLARSFFDKASSTLDILLWQSRKADGMTNIMGKGATGPMEELWQKLSAADERARGWMDRLGRVMAPHLKQLTDAQTRLEESHGRLLDIRDGRGRQVRPPEIWRRAYKSDSYTPEMLFAMACHMGSQSNVIRLMSGYQGDDGLTLEHIGAMFGSEIASHVARCLGQYQWRPQNAARGLLTLRDWQAIQGIWDALELLWPDTEATHKRLFGFAPERVSSSCILLTDENGDRVTLEGGYFPVRYDGRISDRVGAWTEEEELLARNEAMYAVPSAKRGFTKSRSQETPGLPILLNLKPIAEHVADAVKFIEYAHLVRLYDRISQNRDFSSLYRQKFGLEDYNMIRPNLRGLLRGERVNDVVAWLEQKIRKFVVPWGLSLNPNVAIMQSTAIFPAMGDIGASHVLKAMANLARQPSLRHDIWAASPYMRSRMENLDQDLARELDRFGVNRAAAVRVGGRLWTWNDVVDLGMKMITAVDGAACCAVWLASYRARLAELRGPGGTAAPGQSAASPDAAAPPSGAASWPGPASGGGAAPSAPARSSKASQSSALAASASSAMSQAAWGESLAGSLHGGAPDPASGPVPDPSASAPESDAASAPASQDAMATRQDYSQRRMTRYASHDAIQPRYASHDAIQSPQEARGARPMSDADPEAPARTDLQANSAQPILNASQEKPMAEDGAASGAGSGADRPVLKLRMGEASRVSRKLQDASLPADEARLEVKPELSGVSAHPGQPELQASPEHSGAEGGISTAPEEGSGNDPRKSAQSLLEDLSSLLPSWARGRTLDGRTVAGKRGSGAPDPLETESTLNLVEFESSLHEAAARYADMIVKQSNPDFDPTSRSSFLRSKGMMRLFNQFSSAISLFASRNRYMLDALGKGRITRGRYARHVAYDFIFPATALFLFFGCLRDFWDREKDPAASFTALLVDQSSMAVPIFGGLAADWTQNLLNMGGGNYRRGELRSSLDSPVELIRNSTGTLGSLRKKQLTREDKKNAMYALFDVMSFMSRLPLSKVARRAERGYDQYRRGEGTPMSIILPKAGK